jgi:hypothetical protein
MTTEQLARASLQRAVETLKKAVEFAHERYADHETARIRFCQYKQGLRLLQAVLSIPDHEAFTKEVEKAAYRALWAINKKAKAVEEQEEFSVSLSELVDEVLASVDTALDILRRGILPQAIKAVSFAAKQGEVISSEYLKSTVGTLYLHIIMARAHLDCLSTPFKARPIDRARLKLARHR